MVEELILKKSHRHYSNRIRHIQTRAPKSLYTETHVSVKQHQYVLLLTLLLFLLWLCAVRAIVRHFFSCGFKRVIFSAGLEWIRQSQYGCCSGFEDSAFTCKYHILLRTQEILIFHTSRIAFVWGEPNQLTNIRK